MGIREVHRGSPPHTRGKDEDLGFNHLLEIDTGKKWEGEFFEQDCDKKFDPTGKVKLMQKICLSAECLI